MKIALRFEGSKRDLNDLFFDLFESGMLRDGLENDAPGGVTIVIGPMPLQKGFAHAAMEITVFVGTNVAVPLFTSWLYDKWKRSGEKPITIVINNRFYQLDKDILTRAIEEQVSRDENEQQ